MSSPLKVFFFFFQQAVLAGIIVNHARQRCAETGQVRAAVRVKHVVGKSFDRFGVGIGILQGDFNLGIFNRLIDIENIFVDELLCQRLSASRNFGCHLRK